jgi:hypothetical protein
MGLSSLKDLTKITVNEVVKLPIIQKNKLARILLLVEDCWTFLDAQLTYLKEEGFDPSNRIKSIDRTIDALCKRYQINKNKLSQQQSVNFTSIKKVFYIGFEYVRKSVPEKEASLISVYILLEALDTFICDGAIYYKEWYDCPLRKKLTETLGDFCEVILNFTTLKYRDLAQRKANILYYILRDHIDYRADAKEKWYKGEKHTLKEFHEKYPSLATYKPDHLFKFEATL